MLQDLLKRAKNGGNVYITEVRKAFEALEDPDTMICSLSLLDAGKKQIYTIKIPKLIRLDEEETAFVRRYLYARVYNILSTLGGTKMTFYIDTENSRLMELIQTLDAVFGVKAEKAKRPGYGKCINVIDRMTEKLCGGTFSFEIINIDQFDSSQSNEAQKSASALQVFLRAANGLEGKTVCGIDIGGTDIKIAVSRDDHIVCFKEYDWFPAQFTLIQQLIDPIAALTRLVRAKISLDSCEESPSDVGVAMELAMRKDATDKDILNAVQIAESFLKEKIILFDGIGLCFPDVVVKNKIVGGEAYKTRGIRTNPNINYDTEFNKLSDLDNLLGKYCKKSDAIKIINDGPMAAFTAAVELSASSSADEVKNGVFAHTLGTELGTGWIDENGAIPDIPLEVYNYIIDLGNYPAKEFDPDDVRSINNFNTGLPGTLQKYTSQSGVFRLAERYFKANRTDLYQELFDKGFILKNPGAAEGLYLQTEPKDLRKPFLEYVMELAEKEDCEICRKIFIEIGEYLAVTWAETEDILQPKIKSRVLFGRLVKRKACYNLMMEGANKIIPGIEMLVADEDLANTKLMRELKENKEYTVAQFAQAVGAIYYANSFL